MYPDPMKTIITGFALSLITALLTVLGLAATSSPALAGSCTGPVCGTIRHITDAGYDRAIKIRCNFGDPDSFAKVREGESSTKYCVDTDQVGVRDNEEIWCKYTTYGPSGTHVSWQKKFDAKGWHKISDNFNDGDGCVVQRD